MEVSKAFALTWCEGILDMSKGDHQALWVCSTTKRSKTVIYHFTLSSSTRYYTLTRVLFDRNGLILTERIRWENYLTVMFSLPVYLGQCATTNESINPSFLSGKIQNAGQGRQGMRKPSPKGWLDPRWSMYMHWIFWLNTEQMVCTECGEWKSLFIERSEGGFLGLNGNIDTVALIFKILAKRTNQADLRNIWNVGKDIHCTIFDYKYGGGGIKLLTH